MTENGNGNGNYVVRIPRPRFMEKKMALLGKLQYEEWADSDVLAKQALEDGRVSPEGWDFIVFDEDPIPQPRTVPAVVMYGLHADDPDRTITTKEVFRDPTWKLVRKRRGDRPTEFPSADVAAETVKEHLEAAEDYDIPAGNLGYAQVVPVSEFEAELQHGPDARAVERDRRKDWRAAKRKAERAAAEVAALETELASDESIPTDPEEKRRAMLAAVEAGEPVVRVAERFGVADRTIRRYREAEREKHAAQTETPGQMIDPALLGERP